MIDSTEIGFKSEEEMATQFDGIVNMIAEHMKADDKRVGIVNPVKVAQVKFCLGVMRYLTRGTDAVVSYKLHEPLKGMGSVSVVGRSLKFTSAEWFSRAAEFASNTEIYATDDGRVKLTFTFHGLTKPL